MVGTAKGWLCPLRGRQVYSVGILLPGRSIRLMEAAFPGHLWRQCCSCRQVSHLSSSFRSPALRSFPLDLRLAFHYCSKYDVLSCFICLWPNNVGHAPTSSRLPLATVASISRKNTQLHLMPQLQATQPSENLHGPGLRTREYTPS